MTGTEEKRTTKYRETAGKGEDSIAYLPLYHRVRTFKQILSAAVDFRFQHADIR